MSVSILPGGEQIYENRASNYRMAFPPGWEINTQFARHDFQATRPDGADGVLGVNVFTQYMPDLANQTQTDLLDNFGLGDFNDMVQNSFHASFEMMSMGQTPVRHFMIGEQVWFAANYQLTGRTNGNLCALCYFLTFRRGWFYHFKCFFEPAHAQAAQACFERLIRGVDLI